MTDENFTVAEACRWLRNPDGTPFVADMELLRELGRDCSLCARSINVQWSLRPTPHQPWPHERAYPRAVIREVFRLNPTTAKLLPKENS